jgi:hypothetical protein
MVQNTGFQLFCTWHGIDTKTLPDPRKIANVGLADVYNFCIDQLKKMIKEAPNHAALLMDCSTDNFRRRAHINYKLHYCTENFKLAVLTLKTTLFLHPHTAIRIRDDIEATIAEFGLKEKRLTAVTDSGANILAGLRLAKIPRIACVAHNIIS